MISLLTALSKNSFYFRNRPADSLNSLARFISLVLMSPRVKILLKLVRYSEGTVMAFSLLQMTLKK